MKLTGRIRYRPLRVPWGPTLLVLQVQHTAPDGPPDHNGMPESLAGTYWRDARVEDLAGLPNIYKEAP